MRLRSLLFVPGDRPEWMEKALSVGADALILDLEDSVAPANKGKARTAVSRFLRSGNVALFVRINPLDSGMADEDLAAVLPSRPIGIVLPKADGAESIRILATKLSGDIKILPIAGETPAAVFGLGTYGRTADRLCALTWGAEDLAAAVGATDSRHADGSFTDPYRIVRALTLFGAHAANVPAIETVYPDFRDLEGLAAYAARGRRDGFTGMMAIHPSQVPVINQAFTPSDAEIAHAQAVVDIFAANPDSGALSIDGKMVDAPHLKAATAVLIAAGRMVIAAPLPADYVGAGAPIA